MTRIDFLEQLKPILFPKFYSVKDMQNNELIFLDCGGQKVSPGKRKIDKTQTEAFYNHVHFWDRVKAAEKEKITAFGTDIVHNLLEKLTARYKNGKFVVYLQVNSEGAIIRFHQIWKDEPPYYDCAYFSDITEFTNVS
ncbi:hypothetical protein H0R92_09300 [Treponema sp. OMZ 840]|uniref:hypothetical protein n=1 Tax=Treponema sp. OMZ 840 TaxID=244313 RepID=UPI003D914AAF